MEDRFDTNDDYACDDNDSDDEHFCGSSDDEKEFGLEYFLTTEEGKDILKEKKEDEEPVHLDSGGPSEAKKENITLGKTIPKDNLLYDPDIDVQNQQWMDKKRKGYAGGESSKGYKSDAILSCPGCMVTVCVDCQRHDRYKTQFRAMFVMNCYIVADELLKYEIKNKSKKRRKKEGPGKLVPHVKDSDTENKEQEIYNPVKCDCCSTELAVYDRNEVYHFHNVLESLS